MRQSPVTINNRLSNHFPVPRFQISKQDEHAFCKKYDLGDYKISKNNIFRKWFGIVLELFRVFLQKIREPKSRNKQEMPLITENAYN